MHPWPLSSLYLSLHISRSLERSLSSVWSRRIWFFRVRTSLVWLSALGRFEAEEVLFKRRESDEETCGLGLLSDIWAETVSRLVVSCFSWERIVWISIVEEKGEKLGTKGLKMIKMDEKCWIEEKSRVKVKRQDESEWKVQIKDEYEREKRKKKRNASTGNRTRVLCLGNINANHYTTDAYSKFCKLLTFKYCTIFIWEQLLSVCFLWWVGRERVKQAIKCLFFKWNCVIDIRREINLMKGSRTPCRGVKMNVQWLGVLYKGSGFEIPKWEILG